MARFRKPFGFARRQGGLHPKEAPHVAIFHLSVKPVRRAVGRSAVAAAAYRAATRLFSARLGVTHDYRGRSGVVQTIILAPGGIELERERLWNAAEAAEKRVNSVLAREFEISLPHELSDTQRFDLARAFGSTLVERYGIVADIAIHAPPIRTRHRPQEIEASADEAECEPLSLNWHAHILTTTRMLVGSDYTFGPKQRLLDGLKSGAAEVLTVREDWAGLCNTALEAAGSNARIDHRSNAARGIDAVPIGKIGVSAVGFERRTGQKSDRRAYLEEQKAEIEALFADLDAKSAEQIHVPEPIAVVADCDLIRRRLFLLEMEAIAARPSVPTLPSIIEMTDLVMTTDNVVQQTTAPQCDPVRLYAHRAALAGLRDAAALAAKLAMEKLLADRSDPLSDRSPIDVILETSVTAPQCASTISAKTSKVISSRMSLSTPWQNELHDVMAINQRNEKTDDVVVEALDISRHHHGKKMRSVERTSAAWDRFDDASVRGSNREIQASKNNRERRLPSMAVMNTRIVTEPSIWSHEDTFDLHTSGLALLAWSLGDLPSEKDQISFLRVTSLIARAIGIAEWILIAAAARLFEWIRSGRGRAAFEHVQAAGARYGQSLMRVTNASGDIDEFLARIDRRDAAALCCLAVAHRENVALAIANATKQRPPSSSAATHEHGQRMGVRDAAPSITQPEKTPVGAGATEPSAAREEIVSIEREGQPSPRPPRNHRTKSRRQRPPHKDPRLLLRRHVRENRRRPNRPIRSNAEPVEVNEDDERRALGSALVGMGIAGRRRDENIPQETRTGDDTRTLDDRRD